MNYSELAGMTGAILFSGGMVWILAALLMMAWGGRDQMAEKLFVGGFRIGGIGAVMMLGAALVISGGVIFS